MVRKWTHCQQDGGIVIKDGKVTGGGVMVKVTGGDDVEEGDQGIEKTIYVSLVICSKEGKNSCVVLVIKIVVIRGTKEGW